MPGPGLAVPPDELGRFRAELAGHYHLEREIGRGGMATVWLARDLKHDRPIAIKILRPLIAATIGSKRFHQEIRLAARLNHHNILPLYDSGEAAGLIYYVMPYEEHGTLRDMMRHGPRPSVAETLAIGHQVAEGLAYAHGLQVIHRDIKPENILLADGHVFITDFGIARAIEAATTQDASTETGHLVGTIPYMAPEQIMSSTELDGRVDQYALACVLYEMLTGRTPASDGPDRVAEMVHVEHPEAPRAVGTALQRALAPHPEDRFSSIAEFAVALGRPPGVATMIRLPPAVVRMVEKPGRLALGGLGLLAVVTLAWLVSRPPTPPPVTVDAMRYAVLPFEYDGDTDHAPDFELLLGDAISRWDGITVAGTFQVRDIVKRYAGGGLSAKEAAKVALRLGARRYVRGNVSLVGDSLRIHAALYSTLSASPLRDETISLPRSMEGANARLRDLADRLLLPGSLQAGSSTFIGTRSFPARQAYANGQEAVRLWNLDGADTAFALATRSDPGYAQAWMWLALVRAWNSADPATWRIAAEQADAHRDNLPPPDTVLVRAVLAQARGDLGHACPIWKSLTERSPEDFVPWYGSAVCQQTDSLVIPDPRSPSRFSFRTSLHSALLAYQRSFELLPSILTSLRSNSYEPVRKLLRTSPTAPRPGAEPGSTAFGYLAYPAWHADTLAFIPWPLETIQSMEVSEANTALAVHHQLELFNRIAVTWVNTSPEDADALEALAISLELLGDRAALGAIARALDQASPDERGRFAATQARMMFRFGIPDDTAMIRSGVLLVDSLLSTPGSGGKPIAAMAAITGRAVRAAGLAENGSDGQEWAMAPTMRSSAPALLTYAALGGPPDSLVHLEDRVVEAIRQVEHPSDQNLLRVSCLLRAAGLAFPNHPSPRMREFQGADYYVTDAELAYMNDDSAGVRAILDQVDQARKSGGVIDALFPEAWLLAAVGDGEAALDRLAPALDGLATAPIEMFSEPIEAGTLTRAIALRAAVAGRLGRDSEATRWAVAVAILWQDADAFLQPVRRDMARLAMGPSVEPR